MKIISPNELDVLKRKIDTGSEEQRKSVQSIIENVRKRKDSALKDYTKILDKAELDDFRVSEQEIQAAIETLPSSMIKTIQEAIDNIREYHEKQKRQSWFMTRNDGTMLGQKVTPLDSVGVYVPGGTAAYPSSVLMNVIPAQVAGVERIVMVSPPDKDGNLSKGVLASAYLLGVKEIYKVGGAQAVAALAYGTETITPVDKITGPGNIYVALAKREVFGDVDIDMIAGPSEIVVLSDETGDSAEIAADLLSQAEHDERASSILVTTSEKLGHEVAQQVEDQLRTLPREVIARTSVENYGGVVLCKNLTEAIDVVNQLAPEHLEVLVEEPFTYLDQIRHAGAIFIGKYSSEPVGDYFAGTNHVLPTNGTARFSSPLNVDDFMKKSSVIYYSQQAWKENYEKIADFARLEGFEAHARAVEIRKRGN
ncbi:histidinol dehydrogenase [Bacillaceae bacterium S4-13-58]